MAIDALHEKLAQLKPVLDSAGRGIEITNATAPKIIFTLKGFCGGCGCSSSYKDGLKDLVGENCPEMTVVEFIDV